MIRFFTDTFARLSIMKEVIENLSFEDAVIVTAPPGWGKTYKILQAIKECSRSVIFIFPLRALCDEVFLSSQEFRIDCLNLRSSKDLELLKIRDYKLILSTPEILLNKELSGYIYVLDEFHLFYYWGNSFRDKMQALYFEVTSFGAPIVFLTATLGDELKHRLELELKYNYKNIYHLDFGNQKLKNYPKRIFYYPKLLRSWIDDEVLYGINPGCTLIFCKFRREVKELSQKLRDRGFCVLNCVGGEASSFILKLNSTENVDFIVATSVVSHGVNLPNISKIIFNYNVQNLDFYIQMIGRGGRQGESFEVHTLSNTYFSKLQVFIGTGSVMVKRLRNKINKLLYYAYEY